jgi:hypothetical protein
LSFIKKMFHAWLPVGVAFLIGALFVGSASGHTGFPAFLHSGHSDTMAGTLTAKNFKYSTPKVVQYEVPGSAFVAGTPSDVPDHGNYSGAVTLATGEVAVAPVYLPQGAVVTRVTVWHEVESAFDWDLHLEANDNVGGHDDMVILDASACAATPCSTSTTTFSPNTVNNKTRAYGLFLRNDGASPITVFRIVISYRTSALGPASALPQRAQVDTPGSDSNQ